MLYMERELIELCRAFNIGGEFHSIETINNGHINTTFTVKFEEDGKINEYVLQKINQYVFKQPEKVMENISGVTDHIRRKLKKDNKSSDRKTLKFLQSKNGKLFITDNYGDYWRICEFIGNSMTFNETEDLFFIEETGKAFGEFQGFLSDYSAEKLHDTIPQFHNTKNRYENFKRVVEKDPVSRLKFSMSEVAQYLELEEIATIMTTMQQNGELETRVTHNDTKCNNVLFDKVSKKHLCVIDLDTVMPGLIGFDFGDSIRFIANTTAEDEKDLSKVEVDLSKFKAFASGFLKELSDSISEIERKTLVLGAITMTVECGLRFLTDYLEGDIYFKIDYPEQNFDRARCQLKLAQSMIQHRKEMEDIINELSNSKQK